jgi:hypothetical protein
MSKKGELVLTSTTEDLFNAANYLIEKKVVPSSIKRPEDVVTIINMGKQLGMEPITALNSMNLIQGNVALKSSVIPGLLANAGIATELIKDYEPVMVRKPSVMLDKDNKPVVDENGNVKYYRGPDGEILYKETQLEVNGHLEFVTTIRFHRFYEKLNRTISSDYSFYWSDCVSADWHKKD